MPVMTLIAYDCNFSTEPFQMPTWQIKGGCTSLNLLLLYWTAAGMSEFSSAGWLQVHLQLPCGCGRGVDWFARSDYSSSSDD